MTEFATPPTDRSLLLHQLTAERIEHGCGDDGTVWWKTADGRTMRATFNEDGTYISALFE